MNIILCCLIFLDSDNNLRNPSEQLLSTPTSTPRAGRRMSIWDVMGTCTKEPGMKPN